MARWWPYGLAAAALLCLLTLPFIIVLRLLTVPLGLSPADRVLLWLPAVEDAAGRAGLPSALLLGIMRVESGGWVLATDHNCSNGEAAGWRSCRELYGSGVRTVSEDAGLLQVNSGGWPPPAVPTWVRYGLYPDPTDPGRNIAAGAAVLAAALHAGPSLACAVQTYHQGACDGRADAYVGQVEAADAYYQGGLHLDAWAGGGPSGGWITLYAVAGGPYGAPGNFGTAGRARQVVPPAQMVVEVPGQVVCSKTTKGTECFQVKWPLELVTMGDGNLAPDLLFYPGMSVWTGRVNLTAPAGAFNGAGEGSVQVLAAWPAPDGKGGKVYAQSSVPVN